MKKGTSPNTETPSLFKQNTAPLTSFALSGLVRVARAVVVIWLIYRCSVACSGVSLEIRSNDNRGIRGTSTGTGT
eukprot:SAG11_NODE_264_length_11522_cov_14.739210_1_plen_75_part_00